MLNIIIPMAGRGSRLNMYEKPKVLVEINGKPMIQHAVECITPSCEHRFIFIVRNDMLDKYNLNNILESIAPGCILVTTPEVTQGQACSILLAKGFIDNDEPLIQSNSDHFLDFDINTFIDFAKDDSDGTILTFPDTDPKYSYSRLNDDNWIVETAEKKVISNHVNAIIYYKYGKDCVRAIEKTIDKDLRVNGEFYVNPTINELIAEGKKFKIFEIPKNCLHTFGDSKGVQAFKNSGVNK